MLFKHNSFPSTKYKSRDVSEKNGFEKPCSALESTCYRENKNEKLEKSSLNNFGISNFSSDSTAQIWDKLKECCKAKARTHWPNSCANGYFLQSLRVLKKPVCFDEERDISLWNLQRCTCKKYRRTSKELDETLEKLVESDEECESPCLCPKYFISKSGLVFGSHEEVSCSGWFVKLPILWSVLSGLHVRLYPFISSGRLEVCHTNCHQNVTLTVNKSNRRKNILQFSKL